MDLKKSLAGIVIALSISSTAFCSESDKPSLKYLKYISVTSYLVGCGYFIKKREDNLKNKYQ